eukprot:gene32592-39407_t
MDDNYHLEFVQDFRTEYLRNNKANGSKNIRCYPCCSANGHSFKGFCGQPVLARLTIKQKIDAGLSSVCLLNPYELVVVGEFQPLDDEYSPIDSSTIESCALFETMANSSNFTRAQVMLVQQCAEGTVEVDLQFECRPWFYAWRGNRNKQNTMHAFVVTIFTPSGHSSQLLQKVSRHHSPQFRVSCLRRAGSKAPTTAVSTKTQRPVDCADLPLSYPAKRPRRDAARSKRRSFADEDEANEEEQQRYVEPDDEDSSEEDEAPPPRRQKGARKTAKKAKLRGATKKSVKREGGSISNSSSSVEDSGVSAPLLPLLPPLPSPSDSDSGDDLVADLLLSPSYLRSFSRSLAGPDSQRPLSLPLSTAQPPAPAPAPVPVSQSSSSAGLPTSAQLLQSAALYALLFAARQGDMSLEAGETDALAGAMARMPWEMFQPARRAAAKAEQQDHDDDAAAAADDDGDDGDDEAGVGLIVLPKRDDDDTD